MYNTIIYRKHYAGTSKAGKPYAFDKFFVKADTPIGEITVEVTPTDRSNANTLALIVPEDDDVF